MNMLAPPPRTLSVADVPDLAAHVRALGIMTPEDAAKLDAIDRATFVLIRMDQGEYWRCGRCGGKHSVPDVGPVLTRMCIPRPWRGIHQGLYAYSQHLAARTSDLSPEQASRLRVLKAFPTLGDRHPLSARALATGARDVDVVAWMIGSVVEISEADARAYATRINARCYREVVKL